MKWFKNVQQLEISIDDKIFFGKFDGRGISIKLSNEDEFKFFKKWQDLSMNGVSVNKESHYKKNITFMGKFEKGTLYGAFPITLGKKVEIIYDYTIKTKLEWT